MSAKSKSSSSGSRKNKSPKNVCPISLMEEKDMQEDEKFKVCPDPTVYDVDSLAHWVLVQGNDTYPHNREVISASDRQRLKRMWKKLHPNEKSASVSPVSQNSSRASSERSESPVNVYSQVHNYLSRNFGELTENVNGTAITNIISLLRKVYNKVILHDDSAIRSGATYQNMDVQKILDIQLVHMDYSDGMRLYVLCKGLLNGEPTLGLYNIARFKLDDMTYANANSVLGEQGMIIAFYPVSNTALTRYPTGVHPMVSDYFGRMEVHEDNILYFARNLADLRRFDEMPSGLLSELRLFIQVEAVSGGKRKKRVGRK